MDSMYQGAEEGHHVLSCLHTILKHMKNMSCSSEHKQQPHVRKLNTSMKDVFPKNRKTKTEQHKYRLWTPTQESKIKIKHDYLWNLDSSLYTKMSIHFLTDDTCVTFPMNQEHLWEASSKTLYIFYACEFHILQYLRKTPNVTNYAWKKIQINVFHYECANTWRQCVCVCVCVMDVNCKQRPECQESLH